MRRTASLLLAIVSLLPAATRPHYGGTLRMKLRFASLEPSAEDNLTPLVFDRLVTFSDSAQPQPALAIAWRHDADFKRWEFQIRSGVKYHDGSPLTAATLAADIEGMSAQGDSLVFRSQQPAPNLLHILASSSTFKRAADGAVVGTGPFRITAGGAAHRIVLTANEDYWAGRPYLDAIEIETGRTLRDQALDFDLNKADVVELGFTEARRAMQNGKRVWTSPPVSLLALRFAASSDERVREAVALSIDRSTIHNVLLQKQGSPAAGILPQWLSGYAFLFSSARDLDRARQLARGAAPVTLAYDPADATARLIAERIAVNAREAGLVVRPAADGPSAPSARLIRARINSPDPGRALGSVSPGTTAASPEAAYAAELALLQDYRVVPLFHLPEIYGLGPRVRAWAPSRWGGWKLDNVWLTADKP
jgi:peptide/nickel transport system substrate-binding protein